MARRCCDRWSAQRPKRREGTSGQDQSPESRDRRGRGTDTSRYRCEAFLGNHREMRATCRDLARRTVLYFMICLGAIREEESLIRFFIE